MAYESLCSALNTQAAPIVHLVLGDNVLIAALFSVPESEFVPQLLNSTASMVNEHSSPNTIGLFIAKLPMHQISQSVQREVAYVCTATLF